MDERLEKALEFSNFMVTIDNQKRVLPRFYDLYKWWTIFDY